MAEPSGKDDLLRRRLTLREIDLKDSWEQRASLAALLFPSCPKSFTKEGADYKPQEIFRSYFATIHEELGTFKSENHLICTVDDLMTVIQIIKEKFKETKGAIVTEVRNQFQSRNKKQVADEAKVAAASVDFAVNFWLLADFQTIPGRHADNAHRPWTSDKPLFKHIKDTIGEEGEVITEKEKQRRFSPRFTLYDMARLSLIEIEWTNNIAMHLYVQDWKDRRFTDTVYIFSHATLLETIRQSSQSPNKENVSPKDGTIGHDLTINAASGPSSGTAPVGDNTPGQGVSGGESSQATSQHHPKKAFSFSDEDLEKLMAETMDTLDLLMDPGDLDSKAWYSSLRNKDNTKRQKEQRPVDGLDDRAGDLERAKHLVKSELRRVGHYELWRPRLLKLEEAFNRSSPRTIGGWWRDKRNMATWAAFVSAALAIVIAVIAVIVAIASVVTGPMSVDLAKKANHMAAKEQDNNLLPSSVAPETKQGGPPVMTVPRCCGCTACEVPTDGTPGIVIETAMADDTTSRTSTRQD